MSLENYITGHYVVYETAALVHSQPAFNYFFSVHNDVVYNPIRILKSLG